MFNSFEADVLYMYSLKRFDVKFEIQISLNLVLWYLMSCQYSPKLLEHDYK